MDRDLSEVATVLVGVSLDDCDRGITELDGEARIEGVAVLLNGKVAERGGNSKVCHDDYSLGRLPFEENSLGRVAKFSWLIPAVSLELAKGPLGVIQRHRVGPHTPIRAHEKRTKLSLTERIAALQPHVTIFPGTTRLLMVGGL